MIAISKLNAKVSVSLIMSNFINVYLVYDCCHNLEIQSNNSLCSDIPEACGRYHLEYIDANQNPVYKNDKGTFLYYDLQGQVRL